MKNKLGVNLPFRSGSARKRAGEIRMERITFPAILCVLAFALSGCSPPKGEFVGAQDGGGSAAPNYSGYVVLANTATRSVSLYDSSFTESTARVLKIYPTANSSSSLARYDSENVLVTVDGTPDRVDKKNLRTGEVLTGYIMDSTNLTAPLRVYQDFPAGILSSVIIVLARTLNIFQSAPLAS